MTKHGRNKQPIPNVKVPALQTVASLMDAIVDGQEYASIVDKLPAGNLLEDLQKGIRQIEDVRGRPCLAYLGNVVRPDSGGSGVDATDDLPFSEMVGLVPPEVKAIDILLVTNGGSAQQVHRFVDCLRNRFDAVDFLIPSFCMSAGTLFALSGDNIWMTPTAALGPIDPQVPNASGRYVPAQAILTLLDKLRQEGEASLKANGTVPWTAVQIVNGLDPRDIGDAIHATQYSEQMATRFLERYKFKAWITRESSKIPVDDAYRHERAVEVAKNLASHARWNSHGHYISRDVLWDEIKLKIEHPDENLLRALKRIWALCHWTFEKSNVLKVLASTNYRYARSETKKNG